MRLLALMGALCLLALDAAPAHAQAKPPYWASLAAGEVRMRTGPGRNFPSTWLYKRAGLPVMVIAVYTNWRRIEDPDGTSGWVQANLLSSARTALVTGDIRPMHEKPDQAASPVWRAEPGVVGKISQCDRGWCAFEVRGRTGWISTAHVWGVGADERLP